MGFDRPAEQPFKIPVSDTQAYKQFGNAVVVPVVEAVARAHAALHRPANAAQPPQEKERRSVADIVDAATRSRMMSGIRAQTRSPNWLIRRACTARVSATGFMPASSAASPISCFRAYQAVDLRSRLFLARPRLPPLPAAGTRHGFLEGEDRTNRRAIREVARQPAEIGWRQP